MPNCDGKDVDKRIIDEFLEKQSPDSEYNLIGGICDDCGECDFPLRVFCRECGGNLSKLSLSKAGKLYSFSKVIMGADRFDPPYTIGYIDLPEKIRIFSMIDHNEPLDIGINMQLSTGALYETSDTRKIGYMFTPEREQ